MLRFLAPLLIGFHMSLVAVADFPEVFNTEPIDDREMMSAEEAASSMQLPPGFQASVFAAEPDVQNPIAMAWDSRGRIWIAENYTYAERQQRFQLDLRDRVVILDGTTRDHFESRTVFTDNVQMLTGIEVGHDGVWLMCPPKLIFIPDRDHDDAPDSEGEVILDGFAVAEQNYHNFANGLRFGPDGWLYGRCGGSCPGRIGFPGAPDHQRLALEGGMWRYHPTKRLLEVLTTGTTNPWGHDWNSVGEGFFVNTVNGHLWHLIPGAHFTRPFTLDPNRHTYELIDFHADHWHFDTGKSWTDSRDGAANQFGGGHAHIGAMIYQGDNWPETYRDKLFTLNMHGLRANQERLERQGSGYVGRHDADFLIAKDTWFRGMELSAGPDGSVFMLDWSDAGECHEHTGVHRTSGRIFKIQYQTNPKPSQPAIKLGDWTPLQLADTHRHPNQWYVGQARLELARRGQQGADLSAATEKLTEFFEDANADSRLRVQSFLTLHVAGGLNREQRKQALQHPDEHVRVWAVRTLTETWTLDDAFGPTFLAHQRVDSVREQCADLLPHFVQMAKDDESPLVRLTLASTLQRLPIEQRPHLARALVEHAEDAGDHNLPLMIWYGLMAVADEAPDELVDVAAACRLPTTLRLISRCLAEQIESHPKAVNQLLELAISNDTQRAVILQGISEGLKGWRRATKPDNWERLVLLRDEKTAALTTELSVVFGDGRAMDELRRLVMAGDKTEASLRLDALNTLIQSRPEDLRSICESLLTDNQVNFLAARGLATFNDPEIGQMLVDRYNRFRGPYRPQVISILASRPSFALSLVKAIEEGKIPRNDLNAYQVRQIKGFGDQQLNQRMGEAWGEVRETPEERLAQIESLKKQLSDPGEADKRQGRSLFVKLCQNCHRLYGEGAQIGPDLTGGNRSNLDYLLSNIVDPSGVVDKDFRMSILLLDDDRILNGLVIEESERTLTLQTATEKLTLDKDSIQSRKLTEKSPMPDGLLDSLTFEQINDLIAYLRHPTQVPLP